MMEQWTPRSWVGLSAMQQPVYENQDALNKVLKTLETVPPLVHIGEVLTLKKKIAEAGEGKRFLLQGGDCAERFDDCKAPVVVEKIKILLQMSLIMVYGMRKPVTRIGRIAGQYAKPRSNDLETRQGATLPVYRGDIVNGYEFTEESRTPNPERMLRAHTSAAYSLNWIRALVDGGFADVRHPELWKLVSFPQEETPALYKEIENRVSEATRFMELIGGTDNEFLRRVFFYTSHEALLLNYETALTRYAKAEQVHYNSGAHFLWIGERTRQLDGAHIEYMRGLANPIGVKISAKVSPKDLIALIEKLNPHNEKGKLTLITRFGQSAVKGSLPPLLKAVKESGHFVTWSCDPMHGNTITTEDGIKTRPFDNILQELLLTQEAHVAAGTTLGGVHFELTGEDVTECMGGEQKLESSHLSENYQSYCDPRLNYFQSIEMAYRIAEKISHM